MSVHTRCTRADDPPANSASGAQDQGTSPPTAWRWRPGLARCLAWQLMAYGTECFQNGRRQRRAAARWRRCAAGLGILG